MKVTITDYPRDRKIQTIKSLRTAVPGAGLREAKDVIDAVYAGRAVTINAKNPEALTEAGVTWRTAYRGENVTDIRSPMMAERERLARTYKRRRLVRLVREIVTTFLATIMLLTTGAFFIAVIVASVVGTIVLVLQGLGVL